MNTVLVAVEEKTHVAPTKPSVKEYLVKEWLPAVKATVRPTTFRSYQQHVDAHVVPHIGTVKLRLEAPKVKYIDYFHLMKVDGRWWIVHKMSHGTDKTL